MMAGLSYQQSPWSGPSVPCLREGHHAMTALNAFLLGRFRIHADGQEVSGLEGAKVQELLSYLLLHRDRPHPRETLAGTLWGERPTELSRKGLRQALWQLQSA